MKKKSLLILVLLLAVGFAAVSTTLLINGTTKIGVDESFDSDVIFTQANMDDPSTKTKDDNEKGGQATIQDGSKTIIVATGNLSSLGNTSTLTYEITNNNLNYDAQAEIKCVADPRTATEEDIANFERLVTVENSEEIFTVPANGTYNGTLTITLKASALGEDGSGVDVPFQCTIDAYATERANTGNGTAETVRTTTSATN